AIPAGWLNLLIPITAVAGLLVAGHLTAAELNATGTYCGLLGDCEVVQQSAYARLFGVIPIGALGVVGYGAIIVAAMVARRSTGHVAEWAYRALWFMITLGMIFSTYLTFLEPFVIDAVCAWCLISALIMLLLWWLLRLEALPLKSQQQSSEALAH
ncbi:MAG: vitamin K epoxide reductase family protein, partial [Anaerolineae bacterium]|nr:vitamin K epoxide reductase family protein [Anaerolineae bacterium]